MPAEQKLKNQKKNAAKECLYIGSPDSLEPLSTRKLYNFALIIVNKNFFFKLNFNFKTTILNGFKFPPTILYTLSFRLYICNYYHRCRNSTYSLQVSIHTQILVRTRSRRVLKHFQNSNTRQLSTAVTPPETDSHLVNTGPFIKNYTS